MGGQGEFECLREANDAVRSALGEAVWNPTATHLLGGVATGISAFSLAAALLFMRRL